MTMITQWDTTEENRQSHVCEYSALINIYLVTLADKSEITILPHGIHHESPTKCLIGNGVVIEPALLLSDLNNLKTNGIDFKNKLLISER